MDFKSTFDKIISDLQKGARPQLVLSEADIIELNDRLNHLTSNYQEQQLVEVLCILDNSRTLSTKFSCALVTHIKEKRSSEELVMLIGVARRHIVEASHKQGNRVDFSFLEVLKELLHYENSEVVEWTLRVIEGLGSQSRFFKAEVKKIKPRFTIFDGHKKANKEIIELMQGRWK